MDADDASRRVVAASLVVDPGIAWIGSGGVRHTTFSSEARGKLVGSAARLVDVLFRGCHRGTSLFDGGTASLARVVCSQITPG